MASRVKPKVRKETGESVRTFQLRLKGKFPELTDMAVRFGGAKRTVYGQSTLTGKPFSDIKESTCAAFSLPTRVFSAIQIDLGGLVKSAQEKAKFDIGQVEERLEKLAKEIPILVAKLAKKDLSGKARRTCESTLIHKRESEKRQVAKLAALRVRSADPFPSFCFGSRKLFNAQHHLHANGYASHAEWREDWRKKRSDQVMVVGSNDEEFGNKTCLASPNEDGSVSLRLFLGRGHGHLEMPSLRLLYGHEAWVEALLAAQAEFEISRKWQKETATKVEELEAKFTPDLDDEARAERLKAFRSERKKERKAQPKQGHGIAYRFVEDGFGWRIMVTVTKNVPLLQPDFARGAIGLDLNDQHVSRTRVSANGALTDSRDLPLVTVGKTSGQRLAMLHDIADELVCEALVCRVPLVIERLDFAAKKRRLREVGCTAAARRLSSFAYSKFAVVLKAHARLHGVCVVEVNPAYTSVIGAALHAVPNGLTVHGAAAMSIARRAMSVEETLPELLRVWVPGRAPLSMERPSCLRRKAAVDPSWAGWGELSKAVREARAVVQTKRRTGSEMRREARQAAWFAEASAIPF